MDCEEVSLETVVAGVGGAHTFHDVGDLDLEVLLVEGGTLGLALGQQPFENVETVRHGLSGDARAGSDSVELV